VYRYTDKLVNWQFGCSCHLKSFEYGWLQANFKNHPIYIQCTWEKYRIIRWKAFQKYIVHIWSWWIRWEDILNWQLVGTKVFTSSHKYPAGIHNLRIEYKIRIFNKSGEGGGGLHQISIHLHKDISFLSFSSKTSGWPIKSNISFHIL